jgi:hypothetical protein
MTLDDRVAAVARLGFTERQAGFLVHVMLFSGVCIPRQYATSAGIAYGHNVTEFFSKLVQRGDATDCRCLHNRGRVYHVHGRKLYDAIGEPRSLHRRPVPAGRVIERLIRLDGVIASPTVRWLVSEDEKVRVVKELAVSLPDGRLPHLLVGVGARRRLRLFPDDVLMGIEEGRGLVFVYVAINPVEDEWRAAIQRYGDLLAALPRWTWRACFPPPVGRAPVRFHLLFGEELAGPLSSAELRELRWYFEQLRGTETRVNRVAERFQQAHVVTFAAPHFRVLYRRWLVDGDAALEVVSSRRIVEHFDQGTGQVHCIPLRVSHRHLSPLVSLVSLDRTPLRGVEAGVEQGDREGDNAPARPQPPSVDLDEHDPAGCVRDWQRLVDARKPQLSQ